MKNVEFEVYEDLEKCVDSMLFPSDTVIAKLSCEAEEKQIDIYLEVRGEVRVTYKGELYVNPEDFPEELKKIIKQGLLFEHEDVYVGNNNWFEEIIYVDDQSFEGIVFEDNLATYTKKELKSELLETVN